MAISNNFVLKLDSHNRTYRIYKRGQVEIVLDKNYKEVFPDLIYQDLFMNEAKTYFNLGYSIEPLRILKGLNYCRILEKIKITNQSVKVNQLLNEIWERNLHKKMLLELFSDPFGCEKNGLIYINSITSGYRFTINNNFQYTFPDSNFTDWGNEKDLIWSDIQFIKNPERKSKLHNLEKFEKEYIQSKYNIKIKNYKPIVLRIGVTFFKNKNVYNINNYSIYWDYKRGFTQSTKSNIDFVRIHDDLGYLSSFSILTELGKKITLFSREKYYINSNRGIMFSLTYPEESINEAEGIWENFTKSLTVD